MGLVMVGVRIVCLCVWRKVWVWGTRSKNGRAADQLTNR